MQVAQGVAGDEGPVASEERVEEGVQVDRPAMRLSRSSSDSEGAFGGH